MKITESISIGHYYGETFYWTFILHYEYICQPKFNLNMSTDTAAKMDMAIMTHTMALSPKTTLRIDSKYVYFDFIFRDKNYFSLHCKKRLIGDISFYFVFLETKH